MFDTQITVQGWVGGPVTLLEFDSDSKLAKFRLGATPRVRRDGQWIDGETAWFSVRAWGQLGRNVAQSIQRGEAVIVSGRLRRTSWTGESGVENSDWEIDASAIGHDLSRGTSKFVKPEARTPREDREDVPGGVDAATGEILEDADSEETSEGAGSWRAPDPAVV